MSLESDAIKRGAVSEKALAAAKAAASKNKVEAKLYKRFSTKDEASEFLDAHKSSGGYGYIDPYGSDKNGWEVTHWTD